MVYSATRNSKALQWKPATLWLYVSIVYCLIHVSACTHVFCHILTNHKFLNCARYTTYNVDTYLLCSMCMQNESIGCAFDVTQIDHNKEIALLTNTFKYANGWRITVVYVHLFIGVAFIRISVSGQHMHLFGTYILNLAKWKFKQLKIVANDAGNPFTLFNVHVHVHVGWCINLITRCQQ